LLSEALYLADLGYHKLAHFQDISKKGAYWLSRYKTGTNLYSKDSEGNLIALDLKEILANSSDYLELEEVYLSKQYQLPVRLIIEVLPEAVKEKRLKNLKAHITNQSKQRKAYQNTLLRKMLCGFNIFISNVAKEKLTREEISSFYTLRWQIELLLKFGKVF